MKKINFVFFGTDEFSTIVLDELAKKSFLPEIVVTAPDRHQGRKMKLTPPPVKVWAQEKNIEVVQPEKLDSDFVHNLSSGNYDLFIVASYGKIIPKKVLDIPKHGCLNVHPSLLPRFRGASPIETQILEDEKVVGATIILMDEEMDHGPILVQEILEIEDWPPKGDSLEKDLAKLGGKLLAEVIPQWVEGNIETQEQEHELATFTKKIQKEDALIDLDDDPYQNLLKIRAYDKWPRAYFFIPKEDKKIRVVITEAHIEDDKLVLDKIIPEGKSEMVWEDFKRNLD